MPKSRKRNIQKRRKLEELYVRGVELRFSGDDEPKRGPFEDDDGARIPPGDEEVAIWLQPPNPLQREQALRDASAARARAVLSAKRDTGSTEGLEAEAYVSQMATGDLIEYLLEFDSAEHQRQAVREVLAEDEWEDFTDLQDAMRQWEDAGMPEGEEWQPLIERDEEYGRQVKERQRELRESAKEAMQLMARPELEERAVKRRVELAGSTAFIQEYERQMLYYACRDDEDHDLLFFETPEETSEMPDVVREALANELGRFVSDGAEAKNSQRAAVGSEQSEPPEEPETTEASIPEAVSA